jgi:nucleoid-associated protein YgaU
VPAWPSDAVSTQQPTKTSPPRAPDSQSVRVEPGDSLWLIAARRVGTRATPAQIAREWPRWYAANKDVVGDDPSLILPGQVLSAPADSAASSEEGRP